MDEKYTLKAYKGFNKDMTCKGFQYAEGGEYEMPESEVAVCEKGFHSCERPLDILGYYSPANSVYHEVEIGGKMDKKGDDTKVASSRIKVGARLDIRGLVKAQIEYVKEHCTTEHTDSKLATAGEYGAATAGKYGAATSRGSAAVGENGVATARATTPKAKGGLGAVLVLAREQEDSYDLAEWKAEVVDGERIKADTWYTLKDGQFIECE